MSDYYLEREERFGPVTSFLYRIATMIGSMRRLYKFVLDDIGKTRGTLLDVGTGPGDVPILLAKSGRSNIYAIDPSIDMLRIAKSRSAGLGIRYSNGSSRHIPFNRKFHIIISTLSLHHWNDKAGSLRYLARFLDKNGDIRIYEFERKEKKGLFRYFISSHSVTKKEMLDISKKSGLKIKDILIKDGLIRTTFSKN